MIEPDEQDWDDLDGLEVITEDYLRPEGTPLDENEESDEDFEPPKIQRYNPVQLPVPVAPTEVQVPTPEQKKPLQALRPGSVDKDEKYLNFNKYFQSLTVRWDAKQPYKVLASARKRALLLGWTQEDLVTVERSLGIYNSIPRICPGPESLNPITGLKIPGCPCESRYGANPKVWNGCRCPGEQIRVYQLLVQYILDLEIEPTDHVDLQQVADLVRVHLQMERCDQKLSSMNDALFGLQVGGVDNRAGKVYYNEVIAPAIQLQKNLRGDRDRIYRELIATRAQKHKMNKEKVDSAAGLMSAAASGDLLSILSQARKSTLVEQQSRLINHAYPEYKKENDDEDDIEGEFEEG